MKKTNLPFTLSFLLLIMGSFLVRAQCPDDLFFNTQEKVDSLAIKYPNCTVLNGDVNIQGGANITNLQGFKNITAIEGSLFLAGNSALASLAGMDNITSISTWFAAYGNGLTSFNGLNKLKTIGASIDIHNNGSLTSFEGFESLTSIGTFAAVNHNNNLASFEGLSALVSIGHDFNVHDCAQLADFTGLENLKSIGGYFGATRCGTLRNFQGLNSLENIGKYVGIDDNAQLSDLTGLENLKNVGESFILVRNPSIKSLYGLSKLTHVGHDFYFGSNPALESTDGLENLSMIGRNLHFDIHAALIKLSGFENLTTIGGHFELWENNNLSDLNSLNSLRSIGGDLSLVRNTKLGSLEGLASLENIGRNLVIDNNIGLTNLKGLGNLKSIGSGPDPGVYIYNNDKLSECAIEALCNVIFTKNQSIYNNGGSQGGCRSQDEIRLACGLAAPCPETAMLKTQKEVDDFVQLYPNCTELKQLVIGDPSGLSSDPIVNLHSLHKIQRITSGHLVIFNTRLVDLTGLNNLKSVSRAINISASPLLSSLEGFSSLESIGGGLFLSKLQAFTSLQGLKPGVVNHYFLQIQECPALTSLESLSAILTGNRIRGLFLLNNPGLVNINGLELLTHLPGPLTIRDNAGLVNLNGLKNLVSTGDLITIQNNPILNYCCAIQPLLNSVKTEAGKINISNNKYGCHSLDEINNACSPSPAMPYFKAVLFATLTASPNPTTGIVRIRASMPTLLLDVVDMMGGSQGISHPAATDFEIDLGTRPAGMYVFKLFQGDQLKTLSVIKQ